MARRYFKVGQLVTWVPTTHDPIAESEVEPVGIVTRVEGGDVYVRWADMPDDTFDHSGDEDRLTVLR